MVILLISLAFEIHPGSRRPRPLAVEECAMLWPGCRPTWALERGPRALPVGLHFSKG